jgi:hypothetical protein
MKIRGYDYIMDVPEVPEELKKKLFSGGVRSRHEQRIRQRLSRLGYTLMHRRNGRYWIMAASPMTLDEIEGWITVEKGGR